MNRFDLKAQDLVTGALVGWCDLVDCVEFKPETWDRLRDDHLNEGPLEKRLYAWFLRDPIRMSPVPYKGRLGLMRIDTLPKGII